MKPILILLIIIPGFAFAQDTTDIPVRFVVAGKLVTPWQSLLALFDSTSQRIYARIIDGDSGSFVFRIPSNLKEKLVSIAVQPAIGFHIGSLEYDSLLEITSIDISVTRVKFDKNFSLGVATGKIHDLVEVRFYSKERGFSRFRSVFESINARLWPRKVRRLLVKQRPIEGDLIRDYTLDTFRFVEGK